MHAAYHHHSFFSNFDSIIFITASNWFTEPVSNRYHYAKRFAQFLPVTFVQFSNEVSEPYFEATEIDNVRVLHLTGVNTPYYKIENTTVIKESAKFITRHVGAKPLLWVYNPLAVDLVEAIGSDFCTYHATEIYAQKEKNIFATDDEFVELLIEKTHRLSSIADLVMTVSGGVGESLESIGVPRNKMFQNYNGVDTNSWCLEQDSLDSRFARKTKTVFYQGGINERLDFDLIYEVCSTKSDLQFWFCGAEPKQHNKWQKIVKLPNVTSFGFCTVDELVSKARLCDFGWIPFKRIEQMKNSMPLKLFEYMAVGLSIVSLPITDLQDCHEDLIRFGENSDDFIAILTELSKTVRDKELIAKRVHFAKTQCYDVKFSLAIEHMADIQERVAKVGDKKSLLILYDDKYADQPAIDWHLSSFARYSKHQIMYLPASIIDGMIGFNHFFKNDQALDLIDDIDSPFNFNLYDAIVVHFSVRLSIDGLIAKLIIEKLKRFTGPKILFIQDEYDNVNTTCANIKEMGFSHIFTCVPVDGLDYVYGQLSDLNIEFIPTLTGYIPEDDSIINLGLPLNKRSKMIGYRGRELPLHYGELGFEKKNIGDQVKAEAEKAGLVTDIETEGNKRIYGGWHEFLGSCRATLGTESGNNLFDFDGRLEKLADKYSDKPFEEVYPAHFKKFEAPFKMNQISPKFFEAIMLRTALICFEGTYSGILKPHEHFILLKKDFSNIKEVFEKIRDDAFITELTQRAYNDIVMNGTYKYQDFISEFDEVIDRIVPSSAQTVIMAPIAIKRHGRIYPVHHKDLRHYAITSKHLSGAYQRENFTAKFLSSKEERENFTAKFLSSKEEKGEAPPTHIVFFHKISLKIARILPQKYVNRLKPIYHRLINLLMKISNR
jgi:hypothetical protein